MIRQVSEILRSSPLSGSTKDYITAKADDFRSLARGEERNDGQ